MIYNIELNKKLSLCNFDSEPLTKSQEKQELSINGFTLFITSQKQNIKPLMDFLTPFYNHLYNIDIPVMSIRDDINQEEIVTFDNKEIISQDKELITLILDYQITTLTMDIEEIKEHCENLISTFCSFNPQYKKDSYEITAKLN